MIKVCNKYLVNIHAVDSGMSSNDGVSKYTLDIYSNWLRTLSHVDGGT